MVQELERIGLGGGCHWCTEGIFVSLTGVERVEQGWIASVPPDEAPAEAVIVHYDPTLVTARELIEVHLATHSAASDRALRGKYRSAVYAFSEEKRIAFDAIVNALANDFAGRLLTRVLPFAAFRPSADEYQDYFRRYPERPFCRRYIVPKLSVLRRERQKLFFREKQ